jgi:succinate dehydrogenase / fumarate reductase cytochrome b subunit
MMARNERPLSPHLGVYAWQVSNTLSILHRATGVMLSFGALALVGWLVSIAAGPAEFAAVHGFFRSPLGALMLFGWTFCFFYHLSNGIRHLAWDTGHGFDKRRARHTGWLVVVVATVLTVAVWIKAYFSIEVLGP